jgi:hypothetical protein
MQAKRQEAFSPPRDERLLFGNNVREGRAPSESPALFFPRLPGING